MLTSLIKRYFYNYRTGKFNLVLNPFRILKYIKHKIDFIFYTKEDIVTLKDIRIYQDEKRYQSDWDEEYRWNELKADLKYKIINNCILIPHTYILKKIDKKCSKYINQNAKYRAIDGNHRFAVLREIHGQNHKIKIKYYER